MYIIRKKRAKKRKSERKEQSTMVSVRPVRAKLHNLDS